MIIAQSEKHSCLSEYSFDLASYQFSYDFYLWKGARQNFEFMRYILIK